MNVARKVVSSTAEIYGRIKDTDTPVTEDQPLAPVSPYGTSKVAQDLLTAQFHTGRPPCGHDHVGDLRRQSHIDASLLRCDRDIEQCASRIEESCVTFKKEAVARRTHMLDLPREIEWHRTG